MHCHCGTNNRAPLRTFTDPCKPEVRPGAREESASPAWLAAPTWLAYHKIKILSKTSILYLIRHASVILWVFTCKDVCANKRTLLEDSGPEPAYSGLQTKRVPNRATSGDI